MKNLKNKNVLADGYYPFNSLPMTPSQKEWIPVYGMFVIPDFKDISWDRGIFMGFYHGSATVTVSSLVVLVVKWLYNAL